MLQKGDPAKQKRGDSARLKYESINSEGERGGQRRVRPDEIKKTKKTLSIKGRLSRGGDLYEGMT